MLFERIRDLREDCGYTQAQLAEYLGVKQNTYSGYEINKINVSIEVLAKLADFYGTSTDYLMNLTDQFEPHTRSKT